MSNNFSCLTHKFSRVLEPLKGENRPALTHIFSVQHAAPFSHAQGCANGSLHGAAKYYESGNNALRAAHLHDDMKSYGSETEAICLFSGEAAVHKHGSTQHRKIMWQDQYSATWCSPTVQAVYSKQAENLSVGKTKSYWTNNIIPYGSPIFKAVQQKRCKALYTALTKSPTAPEDAVGEGSERSNVDWSVAVPQ